MIKIFLLIGLALMIFVLKLGVIYVILAMLPTCVAYFIDNTTGKQAARVVGACNLAATLPTLLPMLMNGMRLERIDVTPLMGNYKNWLIIYAAAAGGWCIVFFCRFIARFFVVVYLDYKVAALERFQQKLLAEWGDSLKNS